MSQDLINHSENLAIQRFGPGIKLINPCQNLISDNHIFVSEIYKLPLCIYFLDTNSALQSLNEYELNFLDRNSIKDLVGLTAKDIIRPDVAESWIANDLEVIRTRKKIFKDEILIRKDEITIPLLTIKFPWYDQNNHLIGIFGISAIIDKESGISLADSMSMLTQTGLLNTEITQNQLLPGLSYGYGDIYFTQREKEILFHLVRGKSAKNIAHIFGRSQRTIEHHIENMKFKTKSHSKAELIDKLTGEYQSQGQK